MEEEKALLLRLLEQKANEKDLTTPVGRLSSKLDQVVEAVSKIPKTEIPEQKDIVIPPFPKEIDFRLPGIKMVTLKGDKGEKGDTYTLTEADKKEIASAIDVPIVEKVIERTETIIEKPLVTNEIREVALYDTADSIRNKLELLVGDERLKLDAISGVEKFRNSLLEVMNKGLMSLDTFRGLGIKLNGVKIDNANELNFIGSGSIRSNGQQGVDIALNTGGSSILLQTNGVDNGSQSVLNLKQGTNIIITDDGTGGVTIDSTGGSGITRTVETKSANFNAGSTSNVDYVYFVSGTTTATLPTAVGNTNRYTFVHTDTSTMTLATTGGETIAFYPASPSTTATVTRQGLVVELYSDNVNWWTI